MIVAGLVFSVRLPAVSCEKKIICSFVMVFFLVLYISLCEWWPVWINRHQYQPAGRHTFVWEQHRKENCDGGGGGGVSMMGSESVSVSSRYCAPPVRVMSRHRVHLNSVSTAL